MTNKVLTAKEADRLSMLALAHVGDAVYELLVRSMLTLRGPAQVQDLHRSTVAFVRAEAQAKAAEKLLPLLSEEEAAVYRRGRNCRVHGIPAHANPGEYHAATGLEALFGWLYLLGKEERVRELFRMITEE
jgi:ribonuclease-3 family protein